MKLLTAAFAMIFSTAVSAEEPILIGQSAPLTGPAAAAGTAFVAGAKLYIDQVNRAGGVSGRRIELRTLDDMYLPDRAADNAKKLIDAGAVTLFGFVNTPTSVAGAKVASENGVPFIAPATGASSLRQGDNQYVFNVRASFKAETSRIVSHLQTLGIKRISFFSLLIPESKVMFDHISRLLADSNQTFFTFANVEAGKVDLTKAAAALKPAEMQALVMFCPGKMCSDLITEIRKLGGAPSFYTISSAGDVFGELADQGATIGVTQVMPYPWIPGAFPIVTRYQAAMKSAGDTRIGYWSLEGYISANVLVEGLRRTKGAPSKATILGAMQSLGKLNLGGFELVVDREHRDGSAYTDLTLARSGGKYMR